MQHHVGHAAQHRLGTSEPASPDNHQVRLHVVDRLRDSQPLRTPGPPQQPLGMPPGGASQRHAHPDYSLGLALTLALDHFSQLVCVASHGAQPPTNLVTRERRNP